MYTYEAFERLVKGKSITQVGWDHYLMFVGPDLRWFRKKDGRENTGNSFFLSQRELKGEWQIYESPEESLEKRIKAIVKNSRDIAIPSVCVTTSLLEDMLKYIQDKND
jgi:hypothetical protein